MANFIQDSRSWILFPTKVIFETSMDNIKFQNVLVKENSIDAKDNKSQTQKMESDIKPTKARYLKVKAINYGKLPAWHQGAGGDAFIFVDEVSVN